MQSTQILNIFIQWQINWFKQLKHPRKSAGIEVCFVVAQPQEYITELINEIYIYIKQYALNNPM